MNKELGSPAHPGSPGELDRRLSNKFRLLLLLFRFAFNQGERPMFVSPNVEAVIARRVHDMKAPGGATCMYDQTTGTLIMVVASRENDDAQPKLIRWVMNGPMTLEEAKQEIREAGLQSGFPGMPSEPISIN